MSSRITALTLAVCAALAACDHETSAPGITAPERAPTDLAATMADPGPTPYDWAEFALAADPSPDQQVGAAQAATGGAASGRFELSAPIGNRAAEQYSFTALSTNPSPTAKGEIALKTLFINGVESNVHLDVDCLVIVGNQAWFSGPARRYVLGGVEQPPGLYLVFRVEDNGEGANDPPDRGSPAFGGPPMACTLMPPFPLIPSANANIQVRQR
jgi:hypothetical protein